MPKSENTTIVPSSVPHISAYLPARWQERARLHTRTEAF
jgi:hypothetical protein